MTLKINPIVVGAIIALALLYFGTSFVVADFRWLNDVLEWPRGDRAILLFFSAMMAFFGCLIAAAFR